MPYETTRRHVSWLIANDFCLRQADGLLFSPRVMRDPEMTGKLTQWGYEAIANTPEEHQAQTTALVTQWIEVGKKVNLKE